MKPRTLLVFSVGIAKVALAFAAASSTFTEQSQAPGENTQLQTTANPGSLELRIAQETALIRDGEQHGLEPLKMGRLWAHLGIDYEDALEFAKAEAAYNHSLRILKASPAGTADYANVLDNLGSMYLRVGNLAEAERCSRNSLVVREKMGDKLQIARGKWHLADVELSEHRASEAKEEALEAYKEMTALKDPQTSDLVSALITLVYAECSYDRCMDGVAHAKWSLALARGATPSEDPIMTGQALLALGFAEWKSRTKDAPEEEMQESIEIFKSQKSRGRTYVLMAMEQYRNYLAAMGRSSDAKQVASEETLLKQQQSASCLNCTVSVYSLEEERAIQSRSQK